MRQHRVRPALGIICGELYRSSLTDVPEPITLPVLAIPWWFRPESRWLRALVAAFGILLPLVVGFVVSLLTHFGRGTDSTFFELVATVIPIFFLATFAQFLSPAFPERPLTLVLVLLGDVAIGEGLSLYAVAASTATTFLTLVCAVELGGQLLDLAVVFVAGAARAERSSVLAVKNPESSRSADVAGPKDAQAVDDG